MFSCAAAWRSCGPLARRAASRFPRDVVQRRTMSSASGSGWSGTNIMYTVLVGASLAGSGGYAYNMLLNDQARLHERLAQIDARAAKQPWTAKPWPPKSADEDEA